MLKTNLRQGKRYRFPTHINDMLIPRERSESLEAFLVIIQPGRATHSHAHADTEQLYFVLSGHGRAVLAFPGGRTEEAELLPDGLLLVPRGVTHQIFCTGGAELRYLCVDAFPAGKPAAEPTWDDHYRAVTGKGTPPAE